MYDIIIIKYHTMDIIIITCLISYMILYMITDLHNASILDTPVPFQELFTGLLDPSTDISSASDKIKLVCPVQLVF